ncbi:MAG: eukaryotic-like serine/threonine-protein kinase [Solirubrobacteraceae bacterium]|jgi:serine/threonine-protein kinase|nr:eukaryotic-like serine/threonine-protein kinase [Solirubrobacteraceae bacterium]
MRDVPAGTVVDQRYQIQSRLGSGGMADVYCAEDLQLGRKVALKLLHQRFAEDAEFVERFRREASSAAGLQHANVVGVYDRGEWDGTYYIAMEYLEGHTLKQLVQAQGPLEPALAIDIVIQILKAARFAHKRGVIHRDLKPHNVMLDEEGRAKVTDFGIARAGASDMTETGSIMGTAQYLSPEQAQGHAVSAASDLYAVGIVLYELLAGRVPFDGDSAVTIALKQVSEAPVPPSAYNPSVPPELDAIVLKALEKDPARRFANADGFITALDHTRRRLVAVPAGQSTAEFAAPVIYPPVAEPPDGEGDGAVAPPVPVEDDADAAAAPMVYPDEPFPPPEERERRGLRWALATLLVLGLLALGILALTGAFSAEKVAVPNVVGTSLSTAATVLENKGFHVQTQQVISDQPRDTVLREDPQPDTKVKKGSTVTLRVSNGPGQAAVPNVDNVPRRDAERRIKKAGFKVSVSREPSDTIASGNVTRTVPPAGTQIDKQSTVTMFVSTGPPQVSVPAVTGKGQDSATADIINAGLKVSVTEQDSNKDPGTVLSQSPSGGALAPKGSTVDIVVARAPRQVTVPSVKGQDQGSASSAITAAGLSPSVSTQTVTNPSQDGKVIDQSPAGGTKANRGSSVSITVGKVSPTPTTPTKTTP